MTTPPDVVRDALLRTEQQIAGADFRGYDPYDALLSPVFDLPVLRTNKTLRLSAQQILRRLPFNIRPLLRIERGRNPVTLGLAAQGYAYLWTIDEPRRPYCEAQLRRCIDELRMLRSSGYSGACWGYDFPWESRYGRLPAFTPSIVATGIITNGLFVAYELAGVSEAFDLCWSACSFVCRDLERTVESDGSFCWGYYPSDRQQVVNATMKGARLCAQVYSVSGDADLRALAERTATWSAKHQRADGAWPYAVEDRRGWVDNFHTGYVLDCFAEYARRTGDGRFASTIRRGWDYYRQNFFIQGRIPRYYDTKTYPIDVTACAQSLLTLSEYGDVELRDDVAEWVVRTMQRPDGSWIYRIYRRHVDRTPYMRWGSAWMFAALARVVYARATSPREVDL
jgi:rhamnogalacturonyl hydrolase YesR